MNTLPEPATAPTYEERTWAMGAHLSTFLGHVIPFGHLLAPLAILLLAPSVIRASSGDFVSNQAKEALNAQISFSAYGIVAFVAAFFIAFAVPVSMVVSPRVSATVWALPLTALVIGIPLFLLLWLLSIILVICAAVAANEGRAYRYPLIFRLVK